MGGSGNQSVPARKSEGQSVAHRVAGLASRAPATRSKHPIPPAPVVREYPARRYDSRALVGKRVVICDDEGITQMQLRRALARAGLQVVGSASNGRQSVEEVLREHPDIVLMDVRMPVMDGLEAARRIMAMYPVCIVMLTGYANEGYEERSHDVGASGYIPKPVSGQALVPLLLEALAVFNRSRAR